MARTTSMPRKKVRDFGQCLRFDGVGDYVEFTQSDLLGWDGEVSISFFIWVTEITAENKPIVDSMWGDNGSGGFQILVYNGKLADCLIGDFSNADVVHGGYTDLTGKWHHVVVTKSVSSVRQRVYVDGVLKSTNSTLSYGAKTLDDNVVLRLMDRRTGSGTIAGYMDDLRIYGREITADEVLELSLFGEVSSQLLHHFKFDEGSGAVVLDSTGGATGAINGATYSTNVPCKSRNSV